MLRSLRPFGTHGLIHNKKKSTLAMGGILKGFAEEEKTRPVPG
jgi:hypothetical protein